MAILDYNQPERKLSEQEIYNALPRKFSFQMSDGRMPLLPSGEIAWQTDKSRAASTAKRYGAESLITIISPPDSDEIKLKTPIENL